MTATDKDKDEGGRFVLCTSCTTAGEAVVMLKAGEGVWQCPNCRKKTTQGDMDGGHIGTATMENTEEE